MIDGALWSGVRPDHDASAPLVPVAVACIVGTTLVFADVRLPISGLALLIGCGFALGRPVGRWLAWTALVSLIGLARGHPERAEPAISESRPVMATGLLIGHPRCDEASCSARFRVDRLRQADTVQATSLVVTLVIQDPAAGNLGLGTRLGVRGHLRRSAPFRNGHAERAGGWRLRVPSPRLVTRLSEPALPFDSWHLRARAAWRPHSDSPVAGLASALVLGDPSRLETAKIQSLRRLGLGHLLAVSGAHLGIVVGFAFLVSGAVTRRGRFWLAIVAALGLLALVGPRASLVRATVMAGVVLLALGLGRRPRLDNALAAAVIVMIAAAPRIVLDLGFRLSVAATAGLIVLTPRWAPVLAAGPFRTAPLRGTRSWLSTGMAASLGAELGAAPFAWPVFAWRSPFSVLVNLVAMPYLTVVLTCLVVATVWGMAFGEVPLIGWLETVTLPWLRLDRVPSGPWTGWPADWTPVGALLAAGGLTLFALGGRSVRATVGLIALSTLQHAHAPAQPSLTVLDVGQGDAILIRDGEEAILVDGGGWRRGDVAGRVLVPALAAARVSRLKAVVLSHADGDHCGGLVDLAGYLVIPEVRAAPSVVDRACGAELARRAGRFVPVEDGDRMRVGRWRLEMIAAPKARSTSANDASLVVRASVRGRSFLLTGDIERGSELALVGADRARLAADVLKVAHHGSDSSSRRAFLDAVGARLAVISVGRRNPYGHPRDEVLDRLRRAGAITLRTDRDGGVRFVVHPGGRLQTSTLAGLRVTRQSPRSSRAPPLRSTAVESNSNDLHDRRHRPDRGGEVGARDRPRRASRWRDRQR